MLSTVVLALAAYLIGSVSSAVVVARLLKLPDPRSAGSRNPGATNVLRLAGKGPAAVTLLGDLLKGTLAVAIARQFDAGPATLALTGTAAFLGHLYPVFFGFRGGKGVATALGVCLGLSPWLAAGLVATWLTVAALFRYSSLAALVAAALSPLYAWLVLRHPAYLVMSLVFAALLIWRHRENIARLRAGTESRIGR